MIQSSFSYKQYQLKFVHSGTKVLPLVFDSVIIITSAIKKPVSSKTSIHKNSEKFMKKPGFCYKSFINQEIG
jgi:hypothetical protein